MRKEDYQNPLGKQALSLPSLVAEQLQRCFDKTKLHSLLSMAEIFDIRKVIITGCGDSLAAAGAVADIFGQLAGVFSCDALEAIEFSRFKTAKDIGIGEPHSPLVIGISSGGGTARIAEVLQKANEIGALSLLLSNKEESRCSSVAQKLFFLDTPKMENDFPGLRSYFASLLGLFTLAVRMGHVRNVLGPDSEEEMQRAILHYVKSYEGILENVDSQMFELAQTFHKFEHMDFIGSGRELYSAMFGSQKFYECNGIVSNYVDAEDWCHIAYHLKNPAQIGTVIWCDKNMRDFSRTLETVRAAVAIGRPTLVITNADAKHFPEAANVVELPDTPAGYEWLMPLMDFMPVALLAGYCCTLAGRKFFNEYNPLTHEYDGSGRFFNREIMTLSTSSIEVIK